MISIRKNITDLEESQKQRDLAFDCYLTAIRNTAHYAIELESSLTEPHRRYLVCLADEVAKAAPGALEESRATFRALLRDYRDKVSRYLSELRDQLSSTAEALQQMVETLSHTEGDHEARMRAAIVGVRQAAESPAGAPLRDFLADAADTIQTSLEQTLREHRIAIAQFQTEIRVLHKRIQTLESDACVDALTRLFTRREMEERIRKAPATGFCLLLIRVTGFRAAELNFNSEIAAVLASAFGRRLRNSLPENAVVGRWSEEEFIVLTQLARPEAVQLAAHLTSYLSGSYACLLDGRTVRPALELRVGTVDGTGDTPEAILHKIAEILGP